MSSPRPIPGCGLTVIQPGRVRNLLDMLRHDGAAFYFATTSLAMTRTGLEYSAQANKLSGESTIRPRDLEPITRSVATLRESMGVLGTTLAGMTLERLHENLLGGKMTIDRLTHDLMELEGRLRDELKLTYLLALDAREAALFSVSECHYGAAVGDAFPKASFDIDEAAKSLALDRCTACVFHLMRAMECAVQALAAKLGIANIERVWGKLLADMTAKIEAMPAGELRDNWSEARTNLYHVKQAWRNDTMHPKQTYTPTEAAAIFEAVKVFMNGLASLI